jgi:hypothetical protein
LSAAKLGFKCAPAMGGADRLRPDAPLPPVDFELILDPANTVDAA